MKTSTGLLVSAFGLLIITAGWFTVQTATIEAATAANMKEAESYSSQTDKMRVVAQNTLTQQSQDRESLATIAGLLESKTEFLTAVSDYKTVVTEAAGKVDTAATDEQVKAQQQKVITAVETNPEYRSDGVLFKDDPVDVLKTATADVNTLTSQLRADIKTYEAQQAQQAARSKPAPNRNPSNPANNSGPYDWYADARNILNQVGGGFVELERFDGNCGSVPNVEACTYGNVIAVGPKFGTISYARKVWVMTHELAHIYQFKVWGTLMDSGTYQALYQDSAGYPAIEKLANCMTKTRGVYYSSLNCSQDMLNFASGIWNGSVQP